MSQASCSCLSFTDLLFTACPATTLQVIFCKMSPLQHALYNGFLGSEPVVAALGGRKLDKDAALATLPAITALKKLCCHPDLVRRGAVGVTACTACLTRLSMAW